MSASAASFSQAMLKRVSAAAANEKKSRSVATTGFTLGQDAGETSAGKLGILSASKRSGRPIWLPNTAAK